MFNALQADKLEMMKKQDEEQRQNLYQHDKQRYVSIFPRPHQI